MSKMKIPTIRKSISCHYYHYYYALLQLLILIEATTKIIQAQQQQQFPNLLLNQENQEQMHDSLRQPVEMSHLIINGTTTISSSSGSGQSGNLVPLVAGEAGLLQTSSNFYSNFQAQKFRVNVSNICEKNQMRATIRMNKPFYGLIHTKDKRRRAACSLEGNGEQSYSMEINYTLNPSDPNHCGVVSHQLQPARHLNQSVGQLQPFQRPQLTLSVVLVVRLHKSIEFSDDRYFLLSCANRCTKPDCSSSNSVLEDHTASPARLVVAPTKAPLIRSSFLASESIVSPTIKQQNGILVGSNKSMEQMQTSAWPTEKCDTMLDLKFQWLVKLCWVLSTLLALMLCAALYLCLNIGKATDRRIKRQRDRRSLVGGSKGKSGGSSSSGSSDGSSSNNNNIIKSLNQHQSKQVLYSPQQVAANENLQPSWPTNNNSSNNLHHHHFVTQMTDDNNNLYLDKQQQQQQRQMILANLNLIEQPAHMILGRSAKLHGHLASSSSFSQPLEARVKRRRSIGSSAALGYHDLREGYQHNQRANLNANQKTKSRSQTTIHYDQSQDPFKTIPFNYTNNGYQSDGDNSNRIYLASDFVGMEVYGMPSTLSRVQPESRMQTFATNHNNNSAESMSHSLPPEVHMHTVHQTTHNNNGATNTLTRQEANRKQVWNNFKPTFVPPPQVEMIQVQGAKKLITQPQQQQQRQEEDQKQASSQFDPQNSRQLINLIQHKHRQQIEQANRTAATIQTSELFAELQRHEQQQQQPNIAVVNQQRSNMSVVQNRPPWR